MADTDSQAVLGRTIIELLEQRAAGKTICPSDAARAVGGERFRSLMQPTRAAAAALVEEGRIEVTQSGRPVDLATARGAIRLRLKERAAAP